MSKREGDKCPHHMAIFTDNLIPKKRNRHLTPVNIGFYEFSYCFENLNSLQIFFTELIRSQFVVVGTQPGKYEEITLWENL